MSRFVVDCGVVLRLAAEQIEVPDTHGLLAPTLLRSQTLSALHEAVHRGALPREVARDRLTHIRGMRIRVTDVLDLLANRLTAAQVLEELPDLEPEDIQACLRFASQRLNHPVVVA